VSYRSFSGSEREFNALSGLGNLWTPPSGFKFPTNDVYLTNLAKGMGDIRPIIESNVDSIIAPIKSHASSVIATIEGTSKIAIPIGGDAFKIASAAMAIGNSKDVAATVVNIGSLLNGTLNLVTDVAKLVGPLSGALAVVPVVGQIASTIIAASASIISALAAGDKARQEEMEECRRQFFQSMPSWCASAYKSQVQVFGTGENDKVTPADVFRPFLYWAKSKPKNAGVEFDERDQAWVPTLGAMFVALCGDQQDLLFYSSNPPYKQFPWLKPGVKAPGKMSQDTRRQMWSLIKGIMAATEDPNRGPTSRQGGMAIFPSLMALVWREFDAGRLTEADIEYAADSIANNFGAIGVCKSADGKSIANHWYSCVDDVKQNLVDSFLQTKLGFRNQYFTGKLGWDPKLDGGKGGWNLKSVPLMQFRKPTASLKLLTATPAMKTILKGVGVYEKASADLLAKKKAEEAAQRASMAKVTKGAIVLGGAGVAAYLLSKKMKTS